jgi:gamma-glutamyltranspeptidase
LLNEAGQAMFGDDSWMDIIDPAIDVAGYGLKLPVGQARITIGQLIDYINSDDADFDLMDLFLRNRDKDNTKRGSQRPVFYE